LQIVVNVSDARVSASPEDVIVTYSLGSCIAVTLYDPAAKCGGMLHFQLPTSTLDQKRAGENPCMFADSGMNRLMEEVERVGGHKRRLQVKLAGGAEMINDKGLFSIGRRNHTAIRKILWQHGLFLAGEQVGGAEPRTVYLTIADGSAVVKSRGQTSPL
jgi:chemotaxis protein CheD